jgi:hypothetical protein
VGRIIICARPRRTSSPLLQNLIFGTETVAHAAAGTNAGSIYNDVEERPAGLLFSADPQLRVVPSSQIQGKIGKMTAI